jgi:hypothetical protein
LIADYELQYIRNISSVYEEFEPDEFCLFSKQKLGKCPYYEKDNSFGKATGQYCMLKSSKQYPVFQPRFVGFESLMKVNLTISNQTQPLNITSFQPFIITPQFSVQAAWLTTPIYGRGLLTLFDGPMIPKVPLNSSSWFMMDDAYLFRPPFDISSSYWLETVKRDPFFCQSYPRSFTRTNSADPKDQFRPFRVSDNDKLNFDPDYATAELITARYDVQKNSLLQPLAQM